jgi:hypothetical protein
MSDSMLSATGGGWYRDAGVLNDSVQQVSQCYQIIHGCYNAGSHCGFEGSVAVSPATVTLNGPSHSTSGTLFGSVTIGGLGSSVIAESPCALYESINLWDSAYLSNI